MTDSNSDPLPPPDQPVARPAATRDLVVRRLRAVRDHLAPLLAAASRTEWLRRHGRWLIPLLLLLGLTLPPVSLLSWLRSWTYARVQPGVELKVPVRGEDGTYLLLRRNTVLRAARLAVFAADDLPSGVAPLPGNPALLGSVYRLDIRGPIPQEARLVTVLDIGEGDQPFVDPFGWDGRRWHWLPVRFTAANLAEVYLPLAEHNILYVAMTEAPDAATSVAASLLPPPAPVPAAIASLPILELPAYTLKRDDGSLATRRMSMPSRHAALYAVVDNREGERRRSDLATNVLVQQGARLRLRQAIVAAVRRDGLRGVVMDFQGLPPHVQGVYADWLGRLRQDLEAGGSELIVAVPMPRATATGWDSSPLDWRTLGRAADGLRILLPNDAPLATETLDAMIRWALQSVERRKLQLAVPVEGRDDVEGEIRPIGYAEALGHILDLAASDLPERIDPGQDVTVDLPTLRAAEFGRDPNTGMWRFYYWDANRRQHTVWLNDAGGLAPAFEIARKYRMDRIALSGVAAGLDPAVWTMVKGFIADGSVVAPQPDYSLQWTLLNGDGQIALQALRPVGTASFAFKAPRAEGQYRLTVSLTAEEGRVAALGDAAQLAVAPPPPPTPTATPRIFIIEATAAPVETAAPPADELQRRAPVVADVTPRATFVDQVDAVVSFREATLRAGPATSAEIKSGLKIGDQLQVLGQTPDGRWLSVRQLGTGLEGWILAELLDLRIPREEIPYLGVDGTAAPLGDAVVTDTPASPPGAGPSATVRPTATRMVP
ncbi:MAG: SH3 domain-containing protein [Ardenticatenia bacterium]|nr:SH3 domain-containing protein [Ardenticatenia bacterium]